MNEYVNRVWTSFLSLVYPENIYCICCGDVLSPLRTYGLCDRCMEDLPWDFQNPFKAYIDEFSFDDVWPVVRYGFYSRNIIYNFKTYGKSYMAKNIGLLLAERVDAEEVEIDAIVAVPLSKEKKISRGYNQAELLASVVSKERRVPFWSDTLKKVHQTESLKTAGKLQRRNMLHGAFVIAQKDQMQFQEKNILLVDDVCTTGSTADACAKVLKQAGARSVFVLCFAASSGHRKFD